MIISHDLDKRFRELQPRKAYRDMKARAESSVVEWRWATWSKFEPEPFYCEKHDFPKGRWISADRAAATPSSVEHGFDAYQRVIVLRRRCGTLPDFYEVYYVYGDDTIETVQYDHRSEKGLINVDRLHFADGRPTRCEKRTDESCMTSEYIYQDGRLTVEYVQLERLDGRRELTKWQYHFFYDDRNRLERITSATADGKHSEVNYRRPKPGESVAALAAKIEPLLEREIVRTIKKAAIREQVWCLLLTYDMLNRPTPPLLAIDNQARRLQVASDHPDEPSCWLWIPVEFSHFGRSDLVLDSPELTELCGLFNQMLSSRDNFRPARTMLNRVAAKLQQHNWRGTLKTTDDFVVTAVDLMAQDDLIANMKKSVPRENIKRLKKDGYL